MGTLHHLPSHSKSESVAAEIESILRRVLADAAFDRMEAKAHAIVGEAVRRLLEGELQRVGDSLGEEVEAGSVRYRRYTPAPATVTFYSLDGPLTVQRWLYRQVGVRNGPTIDPVALSAGIVEGATPALAHSIALGYADDDMRHHHQTLSAALHRPPSRATLERVAKRLAGALKAESSDLEARVRKAESLPSGTTGIAIGLDRTAVPMSELCPGKQRRPRKKPYQRQPPPPT